MGPITPGQEYTVHGTCLQTPFPIFNVGQVYTFIFRKNYEAGWTIHFPSEFFTTPAAFTISVSNTNELRFDLGSFDIRNFTGGDCLIAPSVFSVIDAGGVSRIQLLHVHQIGGVNRITIRSVPSHTWTVGSVTPYWHREALIYPTTYSG